MSLPLFLVDALPAGPEYTLAGAEGHHAAVVTRLRVGDRLLLGDGHGGLAETEVIGVERAVLRLRLGVRRQDPEPDPRLVVVQAVAKGDRGELAVQAMTEVGVDEVQPWSAIRSVVRWRAERGEKSRLRWVATAREASKQARRSHIPRIGASATTADVAARLASVAGALVLHEEATTLLTQVPLPASGEIVLVVGPEGGITTEELDEFTRAGAVLVRLGSSVLRTSTAGIAALSVLSTRLGRW